jgi:hypothetical protein
MAKPISGLSLGDAAAILEMSVEGVRKAILRGELEALVMHRPSGDVYLLQEEKVRAFGRWRDEQIAEGKRPGMPSRGDRERRPADDA